MHSLRLYNLQQAHLHRMQIVPCQNVAKFSQGNAGDSRAVLGVKGRAKPLSSDHKPQNEGKS